MVTATSLFFADNKYHVTTYSWLQKTREHNLKRFNYPRYFLKIQQTYFALIKKHHDLNFVNDD